MSAATTTVHSPISADHLCVGFGKRPVVEGVTLDMQPGELLVLIGTNGSGKSTLLRTLAGLIKPVHGDLHLLGEHAGQLPKRVAYLPQHPVSSHTLPLCVRDMVAMGRYAHLGLMKHAFFNLSARAANNSAKSCGFTTNKITSLLLANSVRSTDLAPYLLEISRALSSRFSVKTI